MGHPKKYSQLRLKPGKTIWLSGQPQILRYTRAELRLAWALGLLLMI